MVIDRQQHMHQRETSIAGAGRTAPGLPALRLSLQSLIRGLTLAGLAWMAVFLVACSGSSATGLPVDATSIDPGNASVQEPQTLIPDSLLLLEDDPNLLGEIPTIVASETLADSGLQVAYTAVDQDQVAPPLSIEAQWLYMQTCLQQNSVSPVVVVQHAQVQPFTSNDDVIRNIDGVAIASSSVRAVSVIQVLESDFDGTLGNPGFNLRSIMGRLIWFSAGLPEREYPFTCARTESS